MNVVSICTLISTFVIPPLIHIHQKEKITPKIAAKGGLSAGQEKIIFSLGAQPGDKNFLQTHGVYLC
jgi:hypothetical protein